MSFASVGKYGYGYGNGYGDGYGNGDGGIL
jgi:hypothetical protein